MGKVTPIAEIIEEMDAGLDRAILSCLQKRVGAEASILKMDLLANLNMMGFGSRLKHSTFERQVRACITSLRKQGYLICASSGDVGYYFAKDRIEYDKFAQNEYVDRIADMQETVDAMNAAANARWGTGVQMGLF